LATLRCRHCNASAPPGVTPEQLDMKSERQLLRIALCCSAVGWAKAGLAARRRGSVMAAIAKRTMRRELYGMGAPGGWKSKSNSRLDAMPWLAGVGAEKTG
jgi:hypothetical protein